MCNCGDAVDREERRDDEELDEFLQTINKLNSKEGYDRAILKSDVLFAEYLADRAQTRRQTEEMFHQRMRQENEMFATRQRGSEQSTAHRDLAIAQQWRDQSRDNVPAS